MYILQLSDCEIYGQRPSLTLVFSLVLAVSLLSIIYLASHHDFVFCSGAKLLLFHLSDPFTFLVIRTRAAPGVRRPTSLGWILAVWLYLFTFHGTFFVQVWNLDEMWAKEYTTSFQLSFFHFVSSAFYSFPENIALLFPNLKPITESKPVAKSTSFSHVVCTIIRYM